MSGMFANLFGSMSLRKLTSAASMRSRVSIAPSVTSRRMVSVRERFSPSPSPRGSVTKSPRGSVTEIKPVTLVIYYGSQTGRSEAFANRLVAAARCIGYAAEVKDLYKFNPDDFVTERHVIFILSAYMDGGATDNAAHFNFWINYQVDANAARLLSDQHYAVFASGDSAFGDHFNLFGIAIDTKLALLGGRRLLECTLGDASKNLDVTYADWETRLFGVLRDSASVMTPLETVTSMRASKPFVPFLVLLQFKTIEVPPPHAVDFQMRLQKQNKLPNLVAQNSHFFDPLPLVFGSLSNEASLWHLELKVNPLLEKWTCRTGDTLVLFMENTPETAHAIASALQFKLQQWIQAVPVSGVPFKHPFPTPCTVLDALTKYYECATVSQRVVGALAPYVANPTERELLESLATDKEAFETRVVSPELSLYGLLLLCPSIEISLDIFLHVVPSMQPRYLTVMSFHEGTVGLYLDVPSKPNATMTSLETHSGAFHAYFTALAAKKECAVRLAKAAKHSLMATVDTTQYLLQALVLPARFSSGDRTQPLVLIAANSWLQPILTLLRERMRPPAATGHHWLFYNCKNQNALPHINEIEGWTDDDVRLTFVVASPPDVKATSFRTLRDAVRAHMSRVLEDIDQQQGRIYVCGKTSFLNDIRQTLLIGKRMQLQRDDGAAEAWLAELLEQDRYVESTRG